MTISEGFEGPLHPLLWQRLPGGAAVPPEPRSVEEALGMMERSHAAAAARLRDAPVTDGETEPLSVAWFTAVREACARTGPVPGVERYLLEWWVTNPPAEDLTQLPWLIGVWQGHWVCWAGTTPWAAADQRVTTTWDRIAFEQAVRFGAEPEHPPADPWTILGTSQLAVPTVILLALAGKPASGTVRLPVTPSPAPSGPELAPTPVPAPPPPPAPAPAPAPAPDVIEGHIPPPPGAPTIEDDGLTGADEASVEPAGDLGQPQPTAGPATDPTEAGDHREDGPVDVAEPDADPGASEADVPAPEADLDASDADLEPTADTGASDADVAEPEADLDAPDADVAEPEADLDAPDADVPAPAADLDTADADLAEPTADPSTSEADLDAQEAEPTGALADVAEPLAGPAADLGGPDAPLVETGGETAEPSEVIAAAPAEELGAEPEPEPSLDGGAVGWGAAAVEPEPVAPIEPAPTPPAPTLPPANWYADPSGRHQLRYWDGSRWTEHAADQATGQVIDPV